jgi:carboxypeptidase Q
VPALNSLRRRSLFLAALLFSCVTSKSIAPAREPTCAYDFARALSLDVGARPAGSGGDVKAQQWALEAMKRIGLSNVHLEKAPVQVWARGTESVELIGVGPLKATALGRSGATPISGVEGDVVFAHSIEEAEKLGPENVAGKVLFVFAPTERSKNGSGYGKGVGVRYRVGALADKLGAVGALIRSVSTSEDEFPHTGSAKASKVPSFALSPTDAANLARAVENKTQRVKLVSTASTFAGESANVVGEWVGTEKPNEIILIGAHLDSWDLGQGALDDASGVGAVLEAMRQLKGVPLRRTVRVVLFANEENGLGGANAYGKAHVAELPLHLLGIEADSGTGAIDGIEWNGSVSNEAVMKQWGQHVLSKGGSLTLNANTGGSDLSPLVAAGVPVLEFVQDRTTYFDFHHSAKDTVEALDANGIEALAQAILSVASLAAASNENLGKALPETE